MFNYGQCFFSFKLLIIKKEILTDDIIIGVGELVRRRVDWLPLNHCTRYFEVIIAVQSVNTVL